MTSTLLLVVLCLVSQLNSSGVQNPDFLTLMQRGRAEYASGHFTTAEDFFSRALKTLSPTDETQRAGVLSELGDAYLNQDELQKAQDAYLQALKIYRRLSKKSQVAVVLRNLGALYSLQRRDDDALRVLQQALKSTKTESGTDTTLAVQILNTMGVVYYRRAKHKKAETFFRQGLQLISNTGVRFDTTMLLNNLGAVYHAQRKYQKAEDFLKRALASAEATYGADHPEVTFSLTALGLVYSDTHRYADSEEYYSRALKILRSGTSNFDTKIARVLAAMSSNYARAGRQVDADEALTEAAVLARRTLYEHPDMANILEAYSHRLKNQGRTQEAEELGFEARRARLSMSLTVRANSGF